MMREWVYLVEKAKQGDLGAFDMLVITFRDMDVKALAYMKECV
jgi:hypothetical protein